MNQLTFNEELQKSLNLAFKMNYLVLDNFRHVDPSNHQGVFLSEDIFGQKTRKQKTYESLYNDYAKSRNNVFNYLQSFFESYNFPQYFIQNTNALVELYNNVYKKNIKVSDVFSDKEILDINFLEQFADDVESGSTLSFKERSFCYLALNEFASFYEQYKMWLSTYEIFKTLQDDITSNGSKSLVHGKPTNKNVFVIDKDTYKKFITPILTQIMQEEKMLEKERKTLTKHIKAGHVEKQNDLTIILSVLAAIKLIYLTDSTINERFESATKKPKAKHKIDEILNTFVSKVLFNETDFTIDKIYIHKYEILDLINALSIFRRYDDIVKKLTSIALGSNQDLTTITQEDKYPSV